MIICIQQALALAQREELTQILASTRFIEGKATAGWHARAVKNNLQVPSAEETMQKAIEIVSHALMGHELVHMAARPKALSPLLFSKYMEGMHYGTHVDDAFMGELRSDLSYTLFLSDLLATKGRIGDGP